MQNRSTFKYINEAHFSNLFNWSVGSILGNKLHYKEGFTIEPIGHLIVRNRTKEIIEDEKFYKQVTIKLYGKGVIQRGEELIQGKTIGTKNQFRISEGQFIMSKIDARNGAFGIVPKELEGAITTQDFLSYNINTAKILPDFFNLVTTTEHFAKLCQRASSGTTGRQRVNETEFLNFKIPVPPMEHQLYLIEKHHNTVLLANHNLNKSDCLQKSIRRLFNQEIFTIKEIMSDSKKEKIKLYQFKNIDRWDLWNKPFSLESSYPIIELGNLISNINTGTTPPTSRKDYFLNEVNFYTPTDIGNNKVLINAQRMVSEKSIIDKKARKFDKNTILFVGIGTIGKVGIVGNDYACANQQITGFTINKKVNLNYIYHYLNSFPDITSVEKTKTTLAIINQEKIKKIPIPLPDIKIQNAFVKKLDRINYLTIKALNKGNKLAEEAKKHFESAIFNIEKP